MAIVTFQELCAQTGLTEYAPAEDLLILQQKGDAAQAHIERWLGFSIEDRFGGEDQPGIPNDLKEGVLQLAAWWFEHREAIAETDKLLPYGVQEIISAYREWTF